MKKQLATIAIAACAAVTFGVGVSHADEPAPAPPVTQSTDSSLHAPDPRRPGRHSCADGSPGHPAVVRPFGPRRDRAGLERRSRPDHSRTGPRRSGPSAPGRPADCAARHRRDEPARRARRSSHAARGPARHARCSPPTPSRRHALRTTKRPHAAAEAGRGGVVAQEVRSYATAGPPSADSASTHSVSARRVLLRPIVHARDVTPGAALAVRCVHVRPFQKAW